MLETTLETGTVSPASVSTALTTPRSDTMRLMPVESRISTPSSSASLASATGTARVPPMGYQMPPSVCMCPMEHSTAGELYGEEPTYCTKWSSICDTRGSDTLLRIWPATVLPMRRLSTSFSVARSMFFLRSIVSRMSSTERQKKNFWLTSCRPSLMRRKSR